MAKIWCYVLDTEGITGVSDYSIPSVEEVVDIQLHKLYQCEDDNVDVGHETNKKLYHREDGIINPSDLEEARLNYLAVFHNGVRVTHNGEIVTYIY